MRSKINLRIRNTVLGFYRNISIYYVLGTAQKQFETLKKRYSRKKDSFCKKQNTSGKGAADITKARKELEGYSFLAGLAQFTCLRQKKSSLLPNKDNAIVEILDEDLISSDSDSKASKSDCEILANDLCSNAKKGCH